MVNTTETWNNDIQDEEERELTDHEFEIENDEPEAPHVYSPFSPYFNTK